MPETLEELLANPEVRAEAEEMFDKAEEQGLGSHETVEVMTAWMDAKFDDQGGQ